MLPLAQLRRFFSAHPLLFLFLLAPQVEYLTGSSQLSWLIANPPLFFLFLVHPLFSASLPLLQHRLALPETRGSSLVGNRGLGLAVVGLGIDALGTLLFVGTIRHFFAGPILWTSSCLVMAALVVAAYLVPRDLLRPKVDTPRVRPLSFFILGTVFIWGVTLGADFLANLNVPPIVVAFFFISLGRLALIWVLRNVGQNSNQRQLVALAAA